MADEKLSGLSVKLNVDLSETIKQLKAIERSAKKAKQAVAELNSDLDNFDVRPTIIVKTSANG